MFGQSIRQQILVILFQGLRARRRVGDVIMISKVLFKATFNREVDADEVHLTPGGFALKTNSGKELEFDFLDSCGVVSKDNRNIVLFELSMLDIESFPDSEGYTLQDLRTVTEVESWYIDIYFLDGELHPEFELMSIRNMAIEYYDGETDKFVSVVLPDELITQDLIRDINEANCCGSYAY